MKLSKFLIVLIALPLSALTHANDFAFGGSGASPYPIVQNQIKMLKEHIILQGNHINEPSAKGRWVVICKYEFENTSTEAQKLQMGFPLPTSEGDTNTRRGYHSKKGDPLIYSFQASLDSKPIKVKRTKISPNKVKGLYCSLQPNCVLIGLALQKFAY